MKWFRRRRPPMCTLCGKNPAEKHPSGIGWHDYCTLCLIRIMKDG